MSNRWAAGEGGAINQASPAWGARSHRVSPGRRCSRRI